jgi:hypothetical protein
VFPAFTYLKGRHPWGRWTGHICRRNKIKYLETLVWSFGFGERRRKRKEKKKKITTNCEKCTEKQR